MIKAAVVVLCCLTGVANAATPLLTPPPGARLYAIVSPYARHGTTAFWITPEGARCSRETYNLRGFLTDVDQCATLTPDHTIANLAVHGSTPSGDAAETFGVSQGNATWTSPVDHGTAPASPAIYLAYGGSMDANAILFDLLMASPGHRARLYPSGEASLEKLTEATVGTGAGTRHLTAYELSGLYFEPLPVWADDKGRFYAWVDSGLTWLPQEDVGLRASLLKLQTDAVAARSPVVLHQLLQPDTGPVMFTHARLFDADAHSFRTDMSVTVAGGRITAVSPGAAPAAAGTRVIDATGDTLLPGLWEMHQHYGDDASGPLLLSQGITSARDPGNNNDFTVDRAKRRAAGQLLAPHVYASSLLDGKSPFTAQLGTAVGSLDEALAAVRRAKADGFVAVKLYSSFNPGWVAPTAALAHQLGLHVHGHVPAGMRPLDAVNAGYDEITHINFVMMQAMPDDVVAHSNTSARMTGIGRYAADVDLQAEPMKSLVETLAARHIAVDPTLATFEGELVPEQGDMSPSYAPFLGTLPPNVERNFRTGGIAVPPGSTRAQFRASFAKLSALVEDLHAHGVRIVAGTDGSGLELVHELELYVAAGFTPVDALETATLDAARLVGADGHTGSIKVGKDADLVLVQGDPSTRIGDLRQTRLVMLGGRLLDADAARKVAGFSGRPK